MEFWLSYNNREEILRLPVPPQEFQISHGTNVNVLDINSFGEIAVIGRGKLAELEISSFFPAQEYSFCVYKGLPEPYDCVDLIKKWKDTRRPIRLTITGTNVNLACAIENFSYGEKDCTGDVYFTLNLKEYRFPGAPGSKIIPELKAAKRPAEKTVPKKYTVKSGDCLWAIAKKLYGDGSKYSILVSKNKIPDPDLIYPGQTLVV